jgi:hypothetical protein
MRQKDIEFPDCWEEVKPLEWLHLLKNREKLMTKPGISLLDVKREWCAYVLKNRGYVFQGVDQGAGYAAQQDVYRQQY